MAKRIKNAPQTVRVNVDTSKGTYYMMFQEQAEALYNAGKLAKDVTNFGEYSDSAMQFIDGPLLGPSK